MEEGRSEEEGCRRDRCMEPCWISEPPMRMPSGAASVERKKAERLAHKHLNTDEDDGKHKKREQKLSPSERLAFCFVSKHPPLKNKVKSRTHH
jgi:hypothetical protein